MYLRAGVAHGLSKAVVMLTQDIESLPFDLRAYRVLSYSTDFRRITIFQDNLEQLAINHISGGVPFGSPVTDFAASARGTEVPPLPLTLDSTSVGTETPPSGTPTDVENEDLGVLDYSARLDEAKDDIERITEDWTTSLSVFGQKISVAGEEMNILGESNVPNKAARVLQLTRRVAKDMNEHADELRNEVPGFKDVWTGAMEAAAGLLTTSDYSEPEDIEKLQENDESLPSLSRICRGQWRA